MQQAFGIQNGNRIEKGLPSSVTRSLPDYGKPSHIRASAGLAFQWQSPMDHWYSLTRNQSKKYENDDVEQFQFSIGGSF